MSLEGTGARQLALVDGGRSTAADRRDQAPPPATPSQDELDRLAHLARRVFDVPMVTVSLHAPYPGAQARGPGETHPDPLHRATLHCPTVLLVPDARSDPRFADDPAVVGEPRVRFYAGRRLLNADRVPTGVLSVRDTRTRLLSDAHLLLLDQIAGWIEQEVARAARRSAAARVRAGLLPRPAPTLPGFDLAAGSVLSGGPSGGFFDWCADENDPVPTAAGWFLVDVLGSAAATAVVAAGLRGTLRAYGTRVRDDPAATIASVAAVAHADLTGTSTVATLIAGRLSVDGEVTVADAGHGLSLLVRADGTSEHLATSALPLGIGPAVDRPVRTLHLARGDVLVVFSAGLLALHGGTLAGLEGVETLVREARSAQDVIARIRELARRMGGTTDVTVMVLRRAH